MITWYAALKNDPGLLSTVYRTSFTVEENYPTAAAPWRTYCKYCFQLRRPPISIRRASRTPPVTPPGRVNHGVCMTLAGPRRLGVADMFHHPRRTQIVFQVLPCQMPAGTKQSLPDGVWTTGNDSTKSPTNHAYPQNRRGRILEKMVPGGGCELQAPVIPPALLFCYCFR